LLGILKPHFSRYRQKRPFPPRAARPERAKFGAIRPGADLFMRPETGPVISLPGAPQDCAWRREESALAATSSSTIQTWSASSRGTPELLTARDLEAMLKIDIKTIYGYVQRGLIPYVKIQSNVRFPKDDILAWIQEQSYRPRANAGNGSTRH
ncbi:MAG: helix-turn-helix domain-containing protein, partial [Blastocatellia bacterium]